MRHGLRRASFLVLAALWVVVCSYVLLEGSLQLLARFGAIHEYEDYEYFVSHVLAAPNSRVARVMAPLDDELGWIHEAVAQGAPTDSAGSPGRTLLFLGDSVTFGDAAIHGENDFVTRVAEALTPEAVRVVNAASSGYGIDQMMLRLPREIDAWSPDVIVVAYIPHDLLRVGRTSFVRLTKPTLEIVDGNLVVSPPEDVYAYYREQRRALTRFRYAPWLMAERWRQRRFLLPGFYTDWYASVFEQVVARMADHARRAHAVLVFVEIPNFADQDALRWLAPIMRTILREGAATGDYRFVSLEACLRDRATASAWPTEAFTNSHPGPDGHADIAACVLSEAVRSTLLDIH